MQIDLEGKGDPGGKGGGGARDIYLGGVPPVPHKGEEHGEKERDAEQYKEYQVSSFLNSGKGIRSLCSQAREAGKGIRSLRSQVKVKKVKFFSFSFTSTSTFTFTFTCLI
jgi:G:T/U-mismatch repair DNA glycosylase